MKHTAIFTSVIFASLLTACGGSASSSSDKPGSLLPPDLEVSSSSSSVVSSTGSTSSDSSSVGGGIVNTSLPIYESFEAVDIDGFFSANYKALSTYTDTQFYYSTSGYPADTNPLSVPRMLLTDWTSKALWFGNARFTIGQTRLETGTTSSFDTASWGELDLTKPYRISFCVKDVTGTSSKHLIIFTDNNTSNTSNSINGNASRVLNAGMDQLIPGQRFSVDVNTTASANSFLQFRVESAADVIIDDLVIEYQDTPYSGSIPACTADASFVRPVASSSSSSVSSAASSSDSSSVASSSSSSDVSSSNSSSAASSDSSSSTSSTASSASAAWTAQALSLVGVAEANASGSVSTNEAGSVTLTATGGNLSSSVHNLFYAYQQIAKSDFVLTARIASVSTPDAASTNTYRFGLMVMSDINPVSDGTTYANLAGWADVGMYVNATSGFTGSRANMKTDGTRTRSDITGLAVGNYIRIEVYDDGANKRVRRLTSTDGVSFTQANSTTDFKATSDTDNWFVGVYAAPGANNLTITFDNITVEDYVAPAP